MAVARDTLPYVNGDELTKDILFQKTGRELGPDIQLRVVMDGIPTQDRPAKTDSFVNNSSLGPGTGKPKGFITSTSSITEILNIVGYLCNKKRDATVIDTENSIDITNAKHGKDGNYVGTDQAGAIDGSLFLDDSGTGHQLFDLNTLEAQAPTKPPDFLPVGIIKRILADDDKALKGYKNEGNIQDATDVKNLMSDSIKQMIHILEQTRTIFGPKGWTTLFNQVKGGNANKNQAKRTHRQHRRRYSSKHY